MAVIIRQLENYLTRVAQSPTKFLVAYSGGLDSHVLLHALHSCADRYPITIRAVHINHQLQASAADWAAHCVSQCESLAIDCDVINVDATANGRQSPEEAARAARYRALFSARHADEILLTAHHRTDQAETLLLQLMRGSGLAGLAAMPEQKHKAEQHHRPLLACSREELRSFAEAEGLTWVDDPSNSDIDIRRNYIRHEILPKLSDIWPQAELSIARSASYLSDALALQESFLDVLLPDLLITPDCLEISHLERLPELQQRHCLRHWYQSLGLPRPAAGILDRISNEVIAAQVDAQPRLCFAGSQLLRSGSRLLLLPDWQTSAAESLAVDDEVHINHQAFELSVYVDRAIQSQPVSVIIGDYATSIDLRGQPRALKKFYKERVIPEYLRTVLPLIFIGEDLAIIPDLYEHESVKGVGFSFRMKRLTDVDDSFIKEIFH